MKLTMKFEPSDVEEMITDYFAKSGFVVSNLKELCANFSKAYGEKGINVDVTMSNGAPASEPPDLIKAEELITPEVSIDNAEMRLTATELADPEHHLPSMESILQKSDALKEDKDD